MPNHRGERSRLSLSCLGALLALGLSAGVIEAQQATLRGVVKDSAGFPLSNAEVRISALSRVAHTDTAGAFSISGVVTNTMLELSVRRLGYQLQYLNVTLMGSGGAPIGITLVAEPVTLAGMDIEAKEHPFFKDFELRRSRGIGAFITSSQIDKANSSFPSDVFRSMPGVRLVRVNGGFGIRFAQSTGMSRRDRGSSGECVPMIWVDGQRAPGLEIDEIRAGDIHGIEIYKGMSTTPAQFATSGVTQCGTIVVWTRRKR